MVSTEEWGQAARVLEDWAQHRGGIAAIYLAERFPGRCFIAIRRAPAMAEGDSVRSLLTWSDDLTFLFARPLNILLIDDDHGLRLVQDTLQLIPLRIQVVSMEKRHRKPDPALFSSGVIVAGNSLRSSWLKIA